MSEALIIIDPISPSLKVIQFDGQLDESNVDEKIQTIYRDLEVSKPDMNYILDFTNLNYINSKTIGYLTDIYGKIVQGGGKVVVAAAKPNISDILQVVGLTQLLELYPSLSTAKQTMLALSGESEANEDANTNQTQAQTAPQQEISAAPQQPVQPQPVAPIQQPNIQNQQPPQTAAPQVAPVQPQHFSQPQPVAPIQQPVIQTQQPPQPLAPQPQIAPQTPVQAPPAQYNQPQNIAPQPTANNTQVVNQAPQQYAQPIQQPLQAQQPPTEEKKIEIPEISFAQPEEGNNAPQQ